MLGSKNIDTINNSDVYDIYKDHFLSKKEREQKLLQGIQLASGLKAQVVAKKADDTALAVTTQEKAIKKTSDKRLYVALDISLEYDAIFDESYATSIGEMHTGTTSIPYTKVTSIHYQTLSKKDTTWKNDVNNLSVWSLKSLLLLFFDKRDDFLNKNEDFCNPIIKKILVGINGMRHQLFAVGFKARDIYPELKNIFRENILM